MSKSLVVLLLLAAVVGCSRKDSDSSRKKTAVAAKDTAAFLQPHYSQMTIDSNLEKALIARLTEKESSGPWTTILAIGIALIPILIGYLGYTYTRTQTIANARLEWIKTFRPLVSLYMAGVLKARTAIEELEEKYDAYLAAEKAFDRAKSTVDEKIGQLEDLKRRAANGFLTEQVIKKNAGDLFGEKIAEIKELKAVQEAKAVEKQNAEAALTPVFVQYKKETIDMIKSLNELLFYLDPKIYGKSHEDLEKSIWKLTRFNPDNSKWRKGEDLETLMETVRTDIRIVLAEQWQLAAGTRRNGDQ